VEAIVAAIFAPIWPLLPTPVTITRPEIEPRVSTARVKGSPNPLSSEAARASSPAFSVWMVRTAEARISVLVKSGRIFFISPEYPLPACVSINHIVISKAADRNLALTTSVYALTRFGQVRNPTGMRNRIKTAQTRLAVGRNGFRISVSAICVLSALSPAASQTLGTQGASGSPYQLRGTTGSSVTGEASAASTLYGALPAARPQGGGISSSGIGDAASTGATGAGASAEDLTGSIGSPSALSQADQDYAASLARQNERVGTIDGLPLDSSSDAAELPGLPSGP
jgi:hypothetical protein